MVELEGTTPNWELIQQKTFTRWVNSHLKKRGRQIESLLTDLEDGVALCSLYEIISDEGLGKYTQDPKNQFQKIANQDLVLKKINNFIKDVGIKVQYSPKQVMDGERRPILGMIWCLIHKFQIQGISESELSAKEGLLLWCQKQTKDQKYKDSGVDVKNFSSSWQNGLAFCALIHKHRPDLIPYDDLSKDNALYNLNLAFEVAERDLDIPKLLDAEDLVNDLPDEKSVMTYLTAYWKKFSASDKVQKVAKKIGKVAQKNIEVQDLKDEYETRARSLLEKIARYEVSLSDTSFEHFGNSLERVLGRRAEYNTIKQELPEIAKERANLELLLTSIRSKQKSPPRFGKLYDPDTSLSTQTIRDHTEKLNNTQAQYDLALRDRITEMKRLQVLFSRFQNRAEEIEAWETSRLESLTQETNIVAKSSNGAELDAKLKIHEATFVSEISSVDRSLKETEDLATTIVAGRFEKGAEVQDRIDLLKKRISEVAEGGDRYVTQIKDNIVKLDGIVEKCLNMANILQSCKLFLDDIQLSLSEPVALAQNLDDINTYRETLNTIEDGYKNMLSLLEDAKKVQESLTQESLYSPREHQYSKFTIPEIEQQLDDTRCQINDRRSQLNTEAQKLEKVYNTLKEFEELADSYRRFVEDQKDKLSANAPQNARASFNLDKLKNYLEGLRKTTTTTLQESDQRFATLKEALLKIEEMDIAEQTKTTLNDLTTAYETLNQFIEKTLETTQSQIFLAEKASRDRENVLSDENLTDYTETFQYFDKNRDGCLTKLEFRACAAALGEDIEDSELDRIFELFAQEGDVLSYDSFLGFMKGVAIKQEGESKDDIFNAFQQIASNKGSGITEQEMRSVLDSAHVDYLISVMPRNDDGTFNYDQFVNDTFGDVTPVTPPLE